jgi:YHS domain-containing protein
MAEVVQDVVCGMDVDPDAAAAKSDYGGTTYYFCAAGCKEAFDADPLRYLRGDAPKEMPATAGAAPKKWWEFWKA